MGHESEQLTDGLRKVLQHSVNTLDGETSSRLRRARAQAVEATSQQRWHWQPRRAWVALPLLLVLALVIGLREQRPGIPEPLPDAGDALSIQDYSILTSSQDLELLEDLEFYRWLDGQVEQG